MQECLYTTLEVNKTANETELKRSYYKLAKTWHPDKHTDPKKKKEAEEKFKNITYAYEILSDQKQRQIYDRHGFEGLKSPGSRPGAHPFPPFSSFFGGPDPFSSFFRTNTSRHPKANIRPRVHRVEVPLRTFYHGETIKFSLKQKEPCTSCNLINQYQTCPQCKGSGSCPRMMRMGPGMMVQTAAACPKCKTTGEILPPNTPPCTQKDCQKGLQTRQVQHALEITPGMDYGPQLLENKGDFLKAPNYRNDLILELQPLPNAYQRQGSDLIREETIALGESLLGFDYHIDHVDGERKIRLHSTKVIPPETVKCLPNQGLPTGSVSPVGRSLSTPTSASASTPAKFGDLYIIFKVKFPDSDAITPKTKKVLNQIMKRRQNTTPKQSPKIVPLNLDEATEKSPKAPKPKPKPQGRPRPQNIECNQQ